MYGIKLAIRVKQYLTENISLMTYGFLIPIADLQQLLLESSIEKKKLYFPNNRHNVLTHYKKI